MYVSTYATEHRGAIIPPGISCTGYDGGSYYWLQWMWLYSNYTRTDRNLTMFFCPTRDRDSDPAPAWSIFGNYHYGMNMFICGYRPADSDPSFSYWPKITKFRNTTATFYIADVERNPAMFPSFVGWMPAFVHAGKMSNALFLDGHCESLTKEAFLAPANQWAADPANTWYLYLVQPWHGSSSDKRYIGY
jgi:prepilin-type processing-associated H-X9-DG protein